MILGRRELAILEKLAGVRGWLTKRLLHEARIANTFSNPVSHDLMLLDQVRCSAYREAIHRTVKPGDVVVDLGAGTGLLSFFAAEAGARRVYAIEMSSIAETTAELIQANNLQNQITLIRDNSMRTRLPERCDVLVTETLSTFCFGENILRYVEDARQRFLKPGGRIIPETCDTWLQPFSSEEIGLGQIPARLYGFDFRAHRARRTLKPYVVHASGKTLLELSEPAHCHHVQFREAISDVGQTLTPFLVHTSGRLDGFLGWFEMQLCPGVSISTSPKRPPGNWGQLYFPAPGQPNVSAGQKIVFHLDPRMEQGPSSWLHNVILAPSP